MSDGGSKDNNNGKEFDQNYARKLSGREDFVRAVAKIAVAQVCESEGFQGFQQSALESLADVAIRYVREIGKSANLSANLAGRSECNVFDVIRAFEDLGSILGFPGASDVHHSIASSGTIREITQYVNLAEEIPFAYTLPRFPVTKEHTFPQSFLQLGEEPPGEHIPSWLPAFPRSQSNGGENCGYMVKEAMYEKVVQKEELSLFNNGSLAVFGMERGDSSKMKRVGDINPFIAPPLSYGEKEVSLVDHTCRFLDGGNHVNVMDGFAIMGDEVPNEVAETKEGDKCIGSNARPIVQLKFHRMRKSLPTSRNVIAPNDGDDGKDERKQRADQILKESIENENSLGPAQL